MDSSIDTLGVALDYAQKWPVLPVAWINDEGLCGCRFRAACNRPGKHPLTTNGVKDASTAPEAIKSLWEGRPQANIGICTGQEPGLLVLDVDPRNGGSESLAQLITQYGGLPETLVCGTGGGGWHYYFQHPDRFQLKGKISGHPGLDIKSYNGYVVAPPSRHHSGGIYRWLSDWRTTAIAPPPQWLLELIRAEEKSKGQCKSVGIRTSPPLAWVGGKLSPVDWEILGRLEEGLEGEPYRLLVEGRWRAAGYFTQSEADLALLNRLARLTHGDAGRIYAIFRRTALMRDSKDKSFTYYQLTIQKAIDGMSWRPAQASMGRRSRR